MSRIGCVLTGSFNGMEEKKGERASNCEGKEGEKERKERPTLTIPMGYSEGGKEEENGREWSTDGHRGYITFL